jgi:uncharacterized protein (DUF952 family)
VIYKICRRTEWRAAEASGSFAGSPDDQRDGFIHLSTAAQVAETAARHFGGQDDLVIVAVDDGKVAPALKWERSRGSALFPHLYAPLEIAAVAWTRPLPLGRDGRHQFPLLA